MSRRNFTMLLLAGTALAGCNAPQAPASGSVSQPMAVQLATAREQPLDVLYRTSGTVRGRTTAVLTSKTTGYVRSVAVRAGDRVQAGQVLAVLEANDTSASVRRAHAGLDQSMDARAEADSALVAAEAALRIAKTTHERVQSLHAAEAVSQQELDEAQARLHTATAQAEMARARVRMSSSRISQAKAEIGEAQAALDYSRIVAPFAGQVIERRVEPGSLAAPGMPLLVIEQEGRVLVEAPVEESRAASVALGDAVSVDIEALGKPVQGTVGEIVPIVDAASRAFLVKVDLPTGLTGLRPGMFARVSFRAGRKTPLVVPASAVTRAGALDRLLVADGDRLRLRMVSLGENQDGRTEVLSGLTAGERVVVLPTPAMVDGARFMERP